MDAVKTKRQRVRDEMRANSNKRTENAEAKRLFNMYYDLQDFLDAQDYDTNILEEHLKYETIRFAGKILHSAAMDIEYPER